MSGEIPRWIGNLSLLAVLYLASASFSGPVPDVFSNLTMLQSFSTGSTFINDSMPPSFYQLPQIKEVYLNYQQSVNLSSSFITKSTLSKLGTNGARVLSADLSIICSKAWDFCAIPSSLCKPAGTACNCTITVCSNFTSSSASIGGSTATLPTSSFSNQQTLSLGTSASLQYTRSSTPLISPVSPVSGNDSSQIYNVIYVTIGASFGFCLCAMLIYLWVRQNRSQRQPIRSLESQAVHSAVVKDKNFHDYIRSMTIFRTGPFSNESNLSTQITSAPLTELLAVSFQTAVRTASISELRTPNENQELPKTLCTLEITEEKMEA
jgi:hypothetical protein